MKIELDIKEILWNKVRSAGKAGIINVPKNLIGRSVLVIYQEGDSDVSNSKD
ncbi:MAG: hypothetical protein ACE5J9_09085 [Methanosarcinales archaeon]